MRFEWDEVKNQANIAKHGISFSQITPMFSRYYAAFLDNRVDYGELRYIAIGRVTERFYVTAVITWREHIIRIISARKANKKEKALYEKQKAKNNR